MRIFSLVRKLYVYKKKERSVSIFISHIKQSTLKTFVDVGLVFNDSGFELDRFDLLSKEKIHVTPSYCLSHYRTH